MLICAKCGYLPNVPNVPNVSIDRGTYLSTEMKLREYIEALAATSLSILAGIILARTVWDGWGAFIDWLISRGAPWHIGTVLAIGVFVAAVYLGALQLKKFRKR